jgi:RNA polymerase sigma-70 factor (ECF subfamily)
MLRVRGEPMSTPSGDPFRDGLADGRDEAFAALVERYGTVLFRVAWAILRCRQDAEDAVQDVFVGVARARRNLANVENWRAYLLAALRRAAGKVAKERKASQAPSGDLNQVPAREGRAIDADQSMLLERALGTLPGEQRELIALKIDAGLTFAEISNLLGISANTAASRYRYALEKLRAVLEECFHDAR